MSTSLAGVGGADLLVKIAANFAQMHAACQAAAETLATVRRISDDVADAQASIYAKLSAIGGTHCGALAALKHLQRDLQHISAQIALIPPEFYTAFFRDDPHASLHRRSLRIVQRRVYALLQVVWRALRFVRPLVARTESNFTYVVLQRVWHLNHGAHPPHVAAPSICFNSPGACLA